MGRLRVIWIKNLELQGGSPLLRRLRPASVGFEWTSFWNAQTHTRHIESPNWVASCVVETEAIIPYWRTRKGDQRGGEWEPIKILWGNLVYVPKLIWRAFLLTRLRLYSYREVIDPRNQVRQSEITAEEQQSIQAKHVQDHDNRNRNNEATHNLICISPNNLWMWPRNHEQYTRRMKKAWDF
jgi:hypothetical protein